jgi:hypothetical protein
MDAVSAFLNVDVESEIYMDQPEGYVAYGEKGQRLVCHLKKALYDTREAPRAWNILFTAWLVDYGFIQALVDHGVFTSMHGLLLYIIALCVDDSILVGKQGDFILIFKTALSKQFEIEDFGPAGWLLGCRIERDRSKRILRLSQDQYITDILYEFNMPTSVLVGTPMASKIALNVNSEQPLDKQAFPFPALIGKLVYCSSCTRPNITTDVNHLSRYMVTPTVNHWAHAKRVLIYLNDTRSFCLAFTGNISLDPIMWQDSSFAYGDSRRSRMGFIAMMCGGPLVWGSKLQSTFALSTDRGRIHGYLCRSPRGSFPQSADY